MMDFCCQVFHLVFRFFGTWMICLTWMTHLKCWSAAEAPFISCGETGALLVFPVVCSEPQNHVLFQSRWRFLFWKHEWVNVLKTEKHLLINVLINVYLKPDGKPTTSIKEQSKRSPFPFFYFKKLSFVFLHVDWMKWGINRYFCGEGSWLDIYTSVWKRSSCDRCVQVNSSSEARWALEPGRRRLDPNRLNRASSRTSTTPSSQMKHAPWLKASSLQLHSEEHRYKIKRVFNKNTSYKLRSVSFRSSVKTLFQRRRSLLLWRLN